MIYSAFITKGKNYWSFLFARFFTDKVGKKHCLHDGLVTTVMPLLFSTPSDRWLDWKEPESENEESELIVDIRLKSNTQSV